MASQLFTSIGTMGPIEVPSTWWQWLLSVIGVIGGILLTIVAFRFSVSLDLNALLKARHEKQIARIQNACTHMYIEYAGDGQFIVQRTFISPPGTIQHVCTRCRLASWNPDLDYPNRAEYYVAHYEEYIEAEKAFSKLLKKSGYSK